MKHFFRASAVVLALGMIAATPALDAQIDPPTTGFEQRDGGSWTTYSEEMDFLAEVDALSERVLVTEITRTAEGRAMHLVSIGDPAPATAEEALDRPTVLFICSQHGNEPAGREACLQAIRDFAVTDDPELIRQMQDQTILFVPTANPDGRARNSRGNSRGTDINRDHMALATEEGKAMAQVMLEWEPDAAADLHEYGPSLPVVYDDEMLYLWPRNLNVDESVRGMAKMLAEEYVGEGVEAKGYTAGEYGRYRLHEDDYHVSQSAGDGDEGIGRNVFGLRHAAGILLETAVSSHAERQLGNQGAIVFETRSTAELLNRRVDLHGEAIIETMRFMKDQGNTVSFVNSDAAARKALEGARQDTPVYFNGQDRDETILQNGPSTSSTQAMCGYRLSPGQVEQYGFMLQLQGIKVSADGFVSMAQAAEPLIPLLLDGRANRTVTSATLVQDC